MTRIFTIFVLPWFALGNIPLALSQTFFSTRMGIGPSYINGQDTSAQTSSQHMTLRLGTLRKKSYVTGGVDLSSYRLDTPVELRLDHPSFGNDIRVYLGLYRGPSLAWIAGGGGQIRIYDRTLSENPRPRQFVTQSYEIGFSQDLYRSRFAQIELCTMLRQTVPEKSWQRMYYLRNIRTWQVDLGIKLVDL
jgi:hypothetical protein